METREREQRIGMFLAQRAYAYSLMHIVFGSEPSPEMMQTVNSDRTKDTMNYLQQVFSDQECYSFLAQSLADSKCCIKSPFECADLFIDEDAIKEGVRLDKIATEHVNLFIVPGANYIHQWESAYLGKESMVMQSSTLDVRSYYHNAGFQLQAEQRFPDDHIAAMMDYMGKLAELAYKAFEDGDDNLCKDILATQMTFLKHHVFTWVKDFQKNISEKEYSSFYASWAMVLLVLVYMDSFMTNKALLIL